MAHILFQIIMGSKGELFRRKKKGKKGLKEKKKEKLDLRWGLGQNNENQSNFFSSLPS